VSDAVEKLKASIRKPPFHAWLGVELTEDDAAQGTATVRLPIKADF
jgi:hypothetical protein